MYKTYISSFSKLMNYFIILQINYFIVLCCSASWVTLNSLINIDRQIPNTWLVTLHFKSTHVNSHQILKYLSQTPSNVWVSSVTTQSEHLYKVSLTCARHAENRRTGVDFWHFKTVSSWILAAMFVERLQTKAVDWTTLRLAPPTDFDERVCQIK